MLSQTYRTVPYRVLAHSHSPTSLYNFNFISQSAISFHHLFTLCPHLTCERESFGLVLFRCSNIGSRQPGILAVLFSIFLGILLIYLRNYSEVLSSINMETYPHRVSPHRVSSQSLQRSKNLFADQNNLFGEQKQNNLFGDQISLFGDQSKQIHITLYIYAVLIVIILSV